MVPKISVVIPVFGVEKYIHQMLESIRAQKFEDVEYILVDDGSKDKCPEILDEFVKENSRYMVIHQANSGVSAARNNGLAKATGEYVYIIDSDDWLEEGALEAMWHEAERTQADIIYGDWISERCDGSHYRKCFPHSFTTNDPDTIRKLQFAVNSNNNRVLLRSPEFKYINHLGGAPWRGMFRLSIIKNNHIEFDTYVKGLGDDILFSLHYYEYVKKVSYIQVSLYHYRIVEDSYSHGYKANYLETVSRIYEKMEQFLREYNKDKFAWQAYYIRVLIYLEQGMKRYFQNPCSDKDRETMYREFIKTVGSEPYLSAKKKAPIKYMGVKHILIGTLLLRLNLNQMYWMMHECLRRRNKTS